MKAKRSSERMTFSGAVAFAVVGLVTIGCAPEVVPDESAEADRQIDLPIDAEAAPELQDVGQGETVAQAPPPAPTSPVRRAPTPAPEPEAPAPEAEPEITYMTLTAPAGAELEIELLDAISTRDNQPGDRFEASVVRPVIENDMVLVPVNSIVSGEITAVQKSGGNGDEAVIKLHFIDVFFNGESWPMSASVVEANPETEGRYSTGDKAARVGAGAVAGAILGRVIGGNTRGTVIGAAVGAAAGTAITLATEDVDAVLPEGSILRLRLDEPLVFRVPNTSGD